MSIMYYFLCFCCFIISKIHVKLYNHDIKTMFINYLFLYFFNNNFFSFFVTRGILFDLCCCCSIYSRKLFFLLSIFFNGIDSVFEYKQNDSNIYRSTALTAVSSNLRYSYTAVLLYRFVSIIPPKFDKFIHMNIVLFIFNKKQSIKLFTIIIANF